MASAPVRYRFGDGKEADKQERRRVFAAVAGLFDDHHQGPPQLGPAQKVRRKAAPSFLSQCLDMGAGPDPAPTRAVEPFIETSVADCIPLQNPEQPPPARRLGPRQSLLGASLLL